MDFGRKAAPGAAEIVIIGPSPRGFYRFAPPSYAWFSGTRDTRIPKFPTAITEFYFPNIAILSHRAPYFATFPLNVFRM